jgi:uncharacterized protein YjdB
MMKKRFLNLAAAMAIVISAATFVACGDDEEEPAAVEVSSVTVTPATLALEVGAKQTLSATVEPQNAANKTVTWSSSAPTVAEVNASTGEVTAKAVGTADITAATANGKSAKCAVTVAENVVEVTGVTVTPATLELKVGEKQTLAAGVEPENATDKTVTWNSSASDIAEVNASTGEVTAKAAGTATITATAGKVSNKCEVTVAENVIEVTSVAVPATLALKIGEKQTLEAGVEPEDATNKTVTWSSSAANIAEVNASTGEVTAKAVGTATITATAGGVVSNNCEVTVSAVEVTGVTVTPATLDLTVGDKKTLEAGVEPENATDKTVTWSSSAADIVEVDASTGEITAKAVGTATITATAGGVVSNNCDVTVSPAPDPVLVGSWLFDDPSDFTKAEVGLPLEAIGTGFVAVDGGVRVELGSYYKATHGMAATEGSDRVKEYTFVYDYRLTKLGGDWYGMFQSNLENSDDSDLWIDSGNGSIGVEDYSPANTIPLETDNYHRLVVAFKLPEMKVYVDGELKYTHTVTKESLLLRYSLDPAGVLFFADASGWDTDIDISAISIWDRQLTDDQVTSLGVIE